MDLKVRNEEVFGNADKQKMLLLEDLWGLEFAEEEQALCDEERDEG